MKIAILGGSFDPPHLGHILIAKQVKEKLSVDEVWLMPCNKHSFQKNLSSALHRLAMTRFLVQDSVRVSDIEIKRGGITNTIDTLEELKKLFPTYSFYFILGSDQLSDFHKWPSWQEIIQNYDIIVFPREVALGRLATLAKKAFRLQKIPKNIILMESSDLVLTNISSSRIRDRIKAGLSIEYLVPKEVENYILKHKLYAK